MPVCRYFMQGTCRFGDRCRFVHPTDDSDEQYSRYENSDRTTQSYGRQQSQYDHYSAAGRYGENTRTSNYDRNYSNSYNRNEQHYDRNQQSNFPVTKSHQSRAIGSENEYGQNRFRWLSPDYRQSHNLENRSDNWAQKDSYSRPKNSTPKGNISFSFKAAESEIKDPGKEFSFKATSHELQNHSEMVAEEARAWEIGKQWPFSCFFPFPDKSGLPDFKDISPEELRFNAYKARENNTYDLYIKAVENALLAIVTNRTQYKLKAHDKLNIIEKIYEGERFDPDDCDGRIFASLMGYNQSDVTEPMNSEMPPSSEKSSASSFRFVLPTEETVPTNKDSDVHTSIDKLTAEEREQFESSTFTLGKIPTRPPPSTMCL